MSELGTGAKKILVVSYYGNHNVKDGEFFGTEPFTQRRGLDD